MMTFVLERPRRSPLMALQSTFIHAALVGGALWATSAAADVVIADPGPRQVSIPWTPTKVHARHETPLCECPVPDFPVVSTHLPPIESIDPVDLGRVPVDPRTLAMDLPGGADLDTLLPGGASAASIYQESDVDDLPVLMSAPALRYPRVMAEAGIDGSVTLAFVIDAEGRVQAGSAKVIRTTHQAFVAAAEEAVYASLFRPAKRRGEGVPVLVRQTVSFRH